MTDDKEKLERDRPAEKGRKNDPDLRDESAIQPGVNTISSSATDDANEHLTRTASDNFRTNDTTKGGDKNFDDIGTDKV